MFLKTIRKRLSYDFCYYFTSSVKKEKEIPLLQALYKRYMEFDNLHLQFFNGKNNLSKIKKILYEDIIFVDSGISQKRFFQLLPQVLRKISPDELNACFTINTLFKWRLATYLQSKIKENLYIRGSLIFFYSRPFGCGYFANFPQESFNESWDIANSYYCLQGSDLDIRIENSANFNSIKKQLLSITESIQKQFLSYHNFLTLELTNMPQIVRDDIWPVRDFLLLRKIMPKIAFNKKIIQFKRKINVFKIKQSKLSDNKEEISLSETSIKNLLVAFKRFAYYHKINEDFVNKYLEKWTSLLKTAKRETDFYGYITKKYLFSIFKNLFFLSGCRFSKKEENSLFNELLTEYEKNKI